jgi:predicted DNA-binding transcriptional regulator YafY
MGLRQQERIYTLDRWLREKRRIVAKTAAAELGVDEKTVRRDLTRVLRDRYRLPVAYDRAAKVWFYSSDAAPLPATLVSGADRLALLLSLQAAEQFRGTPIHDRLVALHGRLLETMGADTRAGYAALAAKVRFEGPPVPPLSTAVWQTVLGAVDEGTTLSFVYRTGRDGQVRRRQVDPYVLVVRHREWYLVGHDHLRNEVRTFYLPRMSDVTDTGEPFKVRRGWSLVEYLSTAVDGHQSTGPVHHVVLRFDADAAHLGEGYVWNATQRVSRDAQGRVVVEFDTGALYAVERQVLAWGGRVTVIRPAELTQAVAACASRITSAHGAG